MRSGKGHHENKTNDPTRTKGSTETYIDKQGRQGQLDRDGLVQTITQEVKLDTRQQNPDNKIKKEVKKENTPWTETTNRHKRRWNLNIDKSQTLTVPPGGRSGAKHWTQADAGQGTDYGVSGGQRGGRSGMEHGSWGDDSRFCSCPETRRGVDLRRMAGTGVAAAGTPRRGTGAGAARFPDIGTGETSAWTLPAQDRNWSRRCEVPRRQNRRDVSRDPPVQDRTWSRRGFSRDPRRRNRSGICRDHPVQNRNWDWHGFSRDHPTPEQEWTATQPGLEEVGAWEQAAEGQGSLCGHPLSYVRHPQQNPFGGCGVHQRPGGFWRTGLWLGLEGWGSSPACPAPSQGVG